MIRSWHAPRPCSTPFKCNISKYALKKKSELLATGSKAPLGLPLPICLISAPTTLLLLALACSCSLNIPSLSRFLSWAFIILASWNCLPPDIYWTRSRVSFRKAFPTSPTHKRATAYHSHLLVLYLILILTHFTSKSIKICSYIVCSYKCFSVSFTSICVCVLR